MVWLWNALARVAAMAVTFLFFGKRVAGTPLLSATVATNDGFQFSVNYRTLHPEVQPVEYVRLILLLAAKMIFNNATENPPLQAKRIMEWMGYLSENDLSPDSRLHDIDIEVMMAEEAEISTGRKVVATLGLLSQTMRSIHTSIPLIAYPNQGLYSWLAVVQTSLPKLSQPMIDVMRQSLARMLYHYYDQHADPRSIEALVEVPNDAFMEVVAGVESL